MNEMNFRNLDNLQVPDELMDKLLAIPETADDRPAAIPWWRSRSVIAAASLVLVSVLSLIVYFLIGNKINVPVAVKPSAPATEIIWSTDENGETVATEVMIIPEGETRSDGSRLDGTQPTVPKSVIEQVIENLFGTSDTSPTTASGSSGRSKTDPATKMIPTDGKTDPSQSALTPTQGDEPEDPTQPPDEPEPVEPTDPPDDPPDPTEPSSEVPIEPPFTDTISDLVYIGEIPDGSVIYCWLYDDNTHRRMYEYDAYTQMFYAEVTPLGDGYASLSYMPKAHGVDLPYAGHYQYLWFLSYDGGYTGRRLYLGDINLNN